MASRLLDARRTSTQTMKLRLFLLAAATLVTLAARAIQPVSKLDVEYLPVGAMLTWSCGDAEVTGFAIERSTDGFTFELLTRVVAAKGLEEAYSYLDADRPDAKLYYRVTSYDRAGTSAHSPLAVAQGPSRATWSLAGGYTVDVEAEFAFEVESDAVTMLACELLDFLGEPVSRTELLVTPGPNRLAVATAGLEPGAYRLRVSGDDIYEVVHFAKAAPSDAAATLVRGE